MTVRIIHSLTLNMSVVQVYYQDKLAAISHLIGQDQLPGPKQVHLLAIYKYTKLLSMVTFDKNIHKRSICIITDCMSLRRFLFKNMPFFVDRFSSLV